MKNKLLIPLLFWFSLAQVIAAEPPANVQKDRSTNGLTGNITAGSGIAITATGTGVIGATKTKTVSTIAALKALSVTPLSTGDAVDVAGYYAAADGGGGPFYYDSSSSSTANDGTVVAPTAGSGRWLRLYSGAILAPWFGVIGDGTTDNATRLLALRNYIASTKERLAFPVGTYSYSSGPNWAIGGVDISAYGQVTLKYTGTGNALTFDTGASGETYGVRFLGNFVVQSNGSASDAVYIRGVHYSEFQFRVSGAGTSSAGLKIESSVASLYRKITVSVNQGFAVGATPLNGIVIDRRGSSSDYASACVFEDVLVQGVTGTGIVLQHATMMTFLGGASEANAKGVTLTSDSTSNGFFKTDFEVNTGGDVEDLGFANEYHGILSDSTVTFSSPSRSGKIHGGRINSLVDNGIGTTLVDTTVRIALGTLTGTAVNQARVHVQNAEDGSYYADIVASAITPYAATSVTTAAAGQFAFDTNAWASGRGAMQLYDGTANTFLVGVLASSTPSDGYVPTWHTGGTITWDAVGGGVTSIAGTANQITASAATGPVTLSLPADITVTGSLGQSASGNRVAFTGENTHGTVFIKDTTSNRILLGVLTGSGYGGALVPGGGIIGFSSNDTSADYNTQDSAFSRISPGLIGVGTGAGGSFAGSLKMTNLQVVGLSGTGTRAVVVDANGVMSAP